MLAGATYAAWHAGIEWGFWEGPAECAGGTSLSGGLPDLGNLKVVRCDQPELRLLGLSFAGWNVVASLMIATLAIRGSVTTTEA